MSKNYAFIPARAGSKRIPNKNLVNLSGHPLIAYTIYCSLQSKIFDEVIVSTDSQEIAIVAQEYGAVADSLRPESISGSMSPDIEWLNYELNKGSFRTEDNICILRPTNPLRSPQTLVNAFETFKENREVDSLRAMRPIKEHPSKMWRTIENSNFAIPIDAGLNEITGTHNHSSPLQTLEKLFIQDASLEITSVGSILRNSSIAGQRVISFQMPEYEGFDINYLEDLDYLQFLISKKKVMLPTIKKTFG